MDTKIRIKEEDPLSHVASKNENLFTKNVTLITNTNALLLDNDCDMAFKTEIKLETFFPDFCSQKERDFFAKHLINQIKCETGTCSNNCGLDTKIRICSQKERAFLPENPIIMKVKKYNNDSEVVSKIEIKEEPWWLETETSSVCDDIKDWNFLPVNSPRLYTETVSGDSSDDSPLPSAKTSERSSSFPYESDCPESESQENDIKISSGEKHVHSEQFGKCSDRGNIYSRPLLFHEGERSHVCNICDKGFTQFSDLHNLLHEGKKPHKCEICDKSFTRLSHLKSHKFIHEGKKPYQCEVCEKRFTELSHLKRHNLIHEGKRPYQCEICEKSFTRLSHLKSHNLIHEGKKPHRCEICNMTFTQLSDLKKHNFIHEGRKPHKCEFCNKSFTQLSHLKSHNLIHEGNKPHMCEVCKKRFTHLSHLKRHNLIHKGKKTHRCETCGMSFCQLSNLKSHSAIHEGDSLVWNL